MEVTRFRGLRKSPKSDNLSCNEMWGEAPVNLTNMPHVPFGSRVLGHIPLEKQTKLGGRSFLASAVGLAPNVKGGLLLYNIQSQRLVIRRTFTVLGPYQYEFGVVNKIDNELEEDLLYDPVYHKVSPSPRKNVQKRLPTTMSYEDRNEFEGVPEDPVQHTMTPSDKAQYTYTPVKKSEADRKSAKYFEKIGFTYIDKSPSEQGGGTFQIVDIVKCNNYKKSRNSRTLFYQTYDTSIYDSRPVREYEYEFIPCREVYGHRTTEWLDTANREHLAHMVYLSEEINHSEFDETDKEIIHNMFLCNRVDVLEKPPPSTVKQARGDNESHGYLAAFFREPDAFHRRGATEVPKDLDIQDIPPELILQLMPLFSKKYEGMNFSKFKCRMVASGNKWKNEYGINTFSDMVHMNTLKVLLAMGASANWEICKIDVAEAFLTTTVNKQYPKHISKNTKVDTTYYVRRPPGLTDSDIPFICKPKCYIYGHPLAMNYFNLDVKEMFVDKMNFSISNYDGRVYYRIDHRGTIVVAHAVDDFTILASTPILKQWTIDKIKTFYPDITIQDEIDISLVLGGDQGIQLIGTVDTSYAPDGEDYKSITAAILHMAPNTRSILSMSTRQTICADSSISAEGIGCHLLV